MPSEQLRAKKKNQGGASTNEERAELRELRQQGRTERGLGAGGIIMNNKTSVFGALAVFQALL